nr:hypothetical protein [Thermanaeromonas toyohensis]
MARLILSAMSASVSADVTSTCRPLTSKVPESPREPSGCESDATVWFSARALTSTVWTPAVAPDPADADSTAGSEETAANR